jgi:nicotinate-nucleotide pyrophosphorylase (carboxylating)
MMNMDGMDKTDRRSGDSGRRTHDRHSSRAVTPSFGTPVPVDDRLRFPLSERQLEIVVRDALQEDGAFNDITTIATVVSHRRAHGTIVARAAGVIAGVPLAVAAFRVLDPNVAIRVDVDCGGRAEYGTSVMRISGMARAILSAERVALNFLQRLSGIATLTARYVQAVAGTQAKILDTRKTTPGWRALEKYAVRAGGGTNHRLDLADQVLIKDNHIAAVDGDIGLAVKRARDFAPPGARIEVECESAAQVNAAVSARADVILLDNMRVPELVEALREIRGRALSEASGGISLDNVRAIASTGVDRISVGALTHSAPALDIALDFEALG